MRLFPLVIAFILGTGFSQLCGQTSGPTPHQDPTGNGGALKAQVTTGGSYDARAGNGTRIVNDLRVPGALGDYGLDLTRYWNSLPPEVEPGYSGATPSSDFGGSGWTHSWAWKAEYGEEFPKELPGCDCDDNKYITSITVTFPDGKIIKYFITRLKHGENGIPGSSHHPWGPPYSPTEGWSTRGTVHDRIGNMALDGSEFWIYRADGGSVHFVGHSPVYANGRTVWYYEAREVYDPHGFRTELQYEDWFLKRVLPDGGRSLTFEWGYNIGGGVAPVIRSVTSDAGTAAAQTVSYDYAITGSAVTLSQVTYPEGGKKATYIYGMDWGNPLATEPNYFPLLKDADDPHFAGAMTRIHYDYTGIRCRPGDQPPSDPPEAHFLYLYAQPEAILEERISAASPRVSRLSIECFTGVRKETNGLGAWRFFYYGASAGFGGNLGHQLAKLTDFSTQFPLVNVPFERQTHLNAKPYQVWDARDIQTLLIHNDSSGSPSEVRHTGSDGSSIFYDRKDPNNLSQSEPRDVTRIPNPDSHWLFLQTDERNNTTFFTRDSRRRITKVTYPGGTFEEYQYNHLNQVTAHKLASGTVVYYFYDTSNRLIEEWNDAEGSGAAKKYSYDGEAGQYHYPYNVWRMQDGRARAAGADYSVQMTYNRRHQVTKIEYPATPSAPTPPPTPSATPPLPVAMPQFNPDSGSYPSPVTITITTATAGANIRYTLDGSTPTENHGELIAATSGTVALTSSVQGTVLKAVAFKSTWITSGVKSATYSQLQVAVPEFSPDSGVYPSPLTITVTTGTPGANIRYTLDGSTPTESHGTFIASSTGTVEVASSAQGAVLKAVAFKSGCVTSGVRSATYSQPQVAVPEFSPDSGVYPSNQQPTITITTSTAGANIRYTVDGTNPTETHGSLIAASSGTVSVTSSAGGTVLKAIAVKTGWISSPVKSSAAYTMPRVAAPMINPEGGRYSAEPMAVEVATATAGAHIRYTIDAGNPTESYGILITASSGTVTVTPEADSGTTLRAIAIKPGWTPSEVNGANYKTIPTCEFWWCGPPPAD